MIGSKRLWLLALPLILVGLLLNPPGASAGVDHAKKYRAEVTAYGELIDDEYVWFDAWRVSTQSHINVLIAAKSDPEQWEHIPKIEEAAEVERSLLLQDLVNEKRIVLKGIDQFQKRGLEWITGKNDRKAFKGGVALLKSGFKEIFEATAAVKDALYHIIFADSASAQSKLDSAGPTVLAGQSMADVGVKQLLRILK